MSIPNLFDFATSELSQDAVLCWLASWAGPEAAGSDPLAALGRDFLGALFRKCGRELPEAISSLCVRRQYKNIDVLIKVNSQYAVCIEDKVGTIEHSGQLKRYVEALRADGISNDNILPVYIQTYEQSTYAGVEEAGYSVLRRQELIDVLRPYAHDNGNAIVLDFYRHMEGIDKQVESFRKIALVEWPQLVAPWLAWQGFFCELQLRLSTGEWGYVPNESGGFWAYWWSEHSNDLSQQYLQLEESALCFKISVNERASRGEVRDAWHARILQAARDLGLDVVRPARLGHGQTMTVARFNGDYRVASSDGVLDIDATVERLRKAQEVLSYAATAVI